MDPTFLSNDELTYELNLRGIYNVSTRRLGTATLRGLLLKEFNGSSDEPKDSSGVACAEAETYTCAQISEHIRPDVTAALGANEIRGTEEVFHRLLHLSSRLERIYATGEERETVERLYAETNDMMDELLKKREELVDRTAGAGVSTADQGSQNQSFVNSPVLAPLEYSMGNDRQSRTSVSRIDSQKEPLLTLNMSEEERDSVCRNIRSLLNPAAGVFRPQSGMSGVQVDSLGAWGLDTNHRPGDERGRSETTLERSRRQDQEPRKSFSPGESVGHLRYPNPSTVVNTSGATNKGIVVRTQSTQAFSDNERGKGLGAVPKLTSSRNQLSIPNPLLRSKNIQEGGRSSAQSGSVGNNEIQANPSGMNRGHFEGQQGQVRAKAAYFPVRNPRLREDHELRHDPNPGRNNVPRRNPNIGRDELEEDEVVARGFHYPNEEGYENRQPNRNRRSIPVHQWRIEFSGDGMGLHLYDFLFQLSLHQRSELISNQEMLDCVVHLLSGRAKLWFQALYDEFENWDEFVAAIKDEFLPGNYDYVLLNDISNRTQRFNESFGEYITHMQALFKCLSIPLDEEHKLYIIQKNLSPRYALSMSIAQLEIQTIGQLSVICRRIDMRCSKQVIPLPFQPVQAGINRPAYRRVENRRVCALEENMVEQGRGEEVEAIQRIINQQRPAPEQMGEFRGGRDEERQRDLDQDPFLPGGCWNCRRPGHIFNNCPQPKNRLFCYRCGSEGNTTNNCRRCWGNERGNPHRGQQRDPGNLPRH